MTVLSGFLLVEKPSEVLENDFASLRVRALIGLMVLCLFPDISQLHSDLKQFVVELVELQPELLLLDAVLFRVKPSRDCHILGSSSGVQYFQVFSDFTDLTSQLLIFLQKDGFLVLELFIPENHRGRLGRGPVLGQVKDLSQNFLVKVLLFLGLQQVHDLEVEYPLVLKAEGGRVLVEVGFGVSALVGEEVGVGSRRRFQITFQQLPFEGGGC
jgi:hypothetical protein